VTKRELIRRIAAEQGTDQVMTRKIVQRTLDLILEGVIQNGRIELRNFGVFETKLRAARKARNPKTNQEVAVPEKLVLTFQPGKNIARQVESAGRLPVGGEEDDEGEV
jgi:DNA-binding protein HU-beta/integration host factor subunit beta